MERAPQQKKIGQKVGVAKSTSTLLKSHFFLVAACQGHAIAAQRRSYAAQRRFFAFWLAFELILTKFSAVFTHRTAGSSTSKCTHRHARMHSHHTLLEAENDARHVAAKRCWSDGGVHAISCTAVRTTLGTPPRSATRRQPALLLCCWQLRSCCAASPTQSISNAISNAIVVDRCSCSRARQPCEESARYTHVSKSARRDGASSGQVNTPAQAPALLVSTETKQPAGGTTAGCYASVFMYEELAAAAQPPLANFGDVAARPGHHCHSSTQPPATGARHCQSNVTTLSRLRQPARSAVDEKAQNSTIFRSISPPGDLAIAPTAWA